MNNEQNNNNNPINFAEGVVITKNTGTITGTITLTSGTFTVTGNIGESRSISSFNIGDITNNHISPFASKIYATTITFPMDKIHPARCGTPLKYGYNVSFLEYKHKHYEGIESVSIGEKTVDSLDILLDMTCVMKVIKDISNVGFNNNGSINKDKCDIIKNGRVEFKHPTKLELRVDDEVMLKVLRFHIEMCNDRNILDDNSTDKDGGIYLVSNNCVPFLLNEIVDDIRHGSKKCGLPYDDITNEAPALIGETVTTLEE